MTSTSNWIHTRRHAGAAAKDANQTVAKQQQVMLISVFLTMLAAVLGLVFALLVSAGVTRPVRRLLEGTRAVEAGNLDRRWPSPRATRSAC